MLQQAQALERAGHCCHLYIEGVGSEARARKQVRQLFGVDVARVSYGWGAVTPADAVIATIWYSAVIVRDLPFDCCKLYFVQDYEAWFNPIGDTYLLAEGSYRTGLTPVTIGRWLKQELASRFALPAYHFDFGADLDVYRPLSEIRRELSVCFLYQPEKPRRCARIGLSALGIVKHLVPDVRIQLYGSKEKGPDWLEHEHLGLLGVESCNVLYNRSVLGLSLSSSNPSRVPFEMMAAGLPVVELWGGTTIQDFPGEAVLLSEPSAEAIAEAILQLLEDEPRRRRMGEAGRHFMSHRSIDMEGRQFVQAVERGLAGHEPPTDDGEERLYLGLPVRPGRRVALLPAWLRSRINQPPNAFINTLSPWLRGLVAMVGRVMRRLLDRR
ncbi:glycosyltransferase family protein [Thiorhodococcus mannitoliphagus]|nr:glycosyltransferase [Thiorhodococcus mannitoliphagus]